MEAVILSTVDKVIRNRGDIERNFRFASVTKLFAAYAALIAVANAMWLEMLNDRKMIGGHDPKP